MAAVISQIADAVVTRLNVPSRFSVPVAAERVFDVSHSLETLAGLKVSVLTRAWSGEAAARKLRQNDHEIQVGVQQRVEATAAGCDPMLALVEEIVDHFLSDLSLAGVPSVKLAGASVDPVFVPEHLDEFGVFTSVITLTYREWRDR